MKFTLCCRWAISAGTVFLLVGCGWTAPAVPLAGPDPASADAPVRPVTDTSAIGAYGSYRPVPPQSWRRQNERVTPQPRP